LAQETCDICDGISTTGNCCVETPGIPGCDNGEAAVNHQVAIQAMNYIPATIIIKAGDSVTWTNLDDLPHTVTAKDGTFASGFMPNGAKFTHKFNHIMDGDAPYVCDFHPSMGGLVIIEQSCEGCIWDTNAFCMDVSYDAICANIAQTICKDFCICQ
jgi:plastocyanin